MKTIKAASVVKFMPNCKEHEQIKEKNKNYPFYKNLNLIQELLEKTDFTEGVEIDEEDFEKYIVKDYFLIGIKITEDINLDEYSYLIDAFNVYFCKEGSNVYVQDDALTDTWRDIMINAYSDSNYKKDVRKAIQSDFHTRLDEIVDDYKRQIENL